MSWQDRDEFLKKVLSQVKFSFDHEFIEKELTSHLEERVEEYTADGFTKKEAEEESLRNFGDPVEIGKALNKEHNPFIGWIYYLSSALLGIAVLYLIFTFMIPLGMSVFQRNPSRTIPKENILYRIDVDEKVKIDDRIIHFDEVIYQNNGDLSVVYSEIDTRLFGMGWSFGSLGTISDENGHDYFSGSGFSSGGVYSRGLWTVHSFPEESEKLIIEYDYYHRYYKLDIPLKAGEANE